MRRGEKKKQQIKRVCVKVRKLMDGQVGEKANAHDRAAAARIISLNKVYGLYRVYAGDVVDASPMRKEERKEGQRHC